jgi:hypothetical protein
MLVRASVQLAELLVGFWECILSGTLIATL